LQTENTFKSFFLRSSYLLLAAAWLVTLSFIINNYWFKNSSLNNVQKNVGNAIHQYQNDFNKLCADTTLLTQIENKQYNEDVLKQLVGKEYFVFIYSAEQNLLFWNTQSTEPPACLLDSTSNEGFLSLANGYYVWQKKQVGSATCIALIPVKWNYAIHNEYLRNTFAIDRSVGDDYTVSTKPTGSIVRSNDGTFLFSILQTKKIIHPYNNPAEIICRLLAMLLVLIFIHLMAFYLVQKNFYLGAGFLTVIVVLIRIATYYFPIPLNFRQFELFDPAIYGSNIIMRSLGDLLINSSLFLWIVLFARYYVQDQRSIVYPKNPSFRIAIVFIGIVLLFVCTLMAGFIVSSMVSDSQISFDVVNFFTLNIYSVLGFLVMAIVVMAYFFLTQTMIYLLQPLLPKSIFVQILLLAAIGLLVFATRVGDTSIIFEECLLGWLFIYIVLLLNSSYLRLLASRVSSSRFVFWIFFFSISVMVIIMVENRKNEMNNRQRYAEQLLVKADPSAELLKNAALVDFKGNELAFLFNHDKAPSYDRVKFVKDSLLNVYFAGYIKYDTRLYTFDLQENPLYNEDSAGFYDFNSILETRIQPTSLKGLYYYTVSYNKFSYISKKEVRSPSGELLGYVFLLATPKEYETDALYPELLLKGYTNSIENSPIYSYAVYNHFQLVNSHNDYPFPFRLDSAQLSKAEMADYQKNGYNEFWYRSGADKVVIIARKDNFLLESITLFSYLFCACLLINGFFWLLNTAVRSLIRRRELRVYWQSTIRNQVHSTIILISLILFVVVGVATIFLFIDRYNNNNKEKLSLIIEVMENDISNSLNGPSSFDMSKMYEVGYKEKLEQIISRISEMHAVDINLYDVEGNLQVSSLSLPYSKGIISYKMDPVAYYHLNRLKEIRYFQSETIGTLPYISNYVPVIDASGREVAYLNIPYFSSEARLRQEVSNFLVTIINLNAFIFLIAGIIAFVITNRITRSFSFLRTKMKEINLGEVNEAIVWKRNDEIGELVREYNKMVSKLDERAAELARNEREGAWREMAKQVAHEIKNPLTPMKLSLQYLQKAIENNSDNVKELSSSVSKTLVEQIDHLSQIAGDFSQFANIGNPKNTVFDLNELLQSLSHLYWNEDEPKIVWSPLPMPVFINADRTHINRLFTNLIQNALQAIPEGRVPVVEINEGLDNSNVLISIKDNGVGIDKGQHLNIFTPNFTTKTSGTGLGLAMCKGIVEQNKGAIWFGTEKGVGTTFFVELPVVSDSTL
jgi:two-component system nitrogen regulation sensor histidine kinase NtrY